MHLLKTVTLIYFIPMEKYPKYVEKKNQITFVKKKNKKTKQNKIKKTQVRDTKMLLVVSFLQW